MTYGSACRFFINCWLIASLDSSSFLPPVILGHPILIDDSADSTLFAISETPYVFCAIRPPKRSLTVSDSILEVTLILSSVSIDEQSVPFHLVLLPFPGIWFTIRPIGSSLSMLLIFLHSPVVRHPVWVLYLTVRSKQVTFLEYSLSNGAILQVFKTNSCLSHKKEVLPSNLHRIRPHTDSHHSFSSNLFHATYYSKMILPIIKLNKYVFIKLAEVKPKSLKARFPPTTFIYVGRSVKNTHLLITILRSY